MTDFKVQYQGAQAFKKSGAHIFVRERDVKNVRTFCEKLKFGKVTDYKVHYQGAREFKKRSAHFRT